MPELITTICFALSTLSGGLLAGSAALGAFKKERIISLWPVAERVPSSKAIRASSAITSWLMSSACEHLRSRRSSNVMPEQKIVHLRRLPQDQQHVGMLGDGLNDAPALALGSVGIAMGAIGSDTAIVTADMTLMHDDLTKVAEAIEVGRRTLGIIRFITFSLLVKALFLIQAFTGHAGLWLAILADTDATLSVILNPLRLLRPASQGFVGVG